jgi:thiosulfate/3-mercaptopyruvate sulfurtransferase
MSVLISAAELTARLSSDQPPVVLDVRWQLGGPPGHGEYLTGHIPRAVFVDLHTELAHVTVPTEGRHPLPSVSSLQEAARRWGVGDDSTVVVYDATGNMASARAWWLLRWAGHDDVLILDGALSAWVAEGGELATDDVKPEPGDVTLTGGHLPTIGADDIPDYVAGGGLLLDARAPERYRGEVEPVDPKAGHIPGATNAPTGGNLSADGHFLPADELRARFEALRPDAAMPVAVYCGSGVTAAHEIAALAIAGIDATLYPGSFSEWSNRDLPVDQSS